MVGNQSAALFTPANSLFAPKISAESQAWRIQTQYLRIMGKQQTHRYEDICPHTWVPKRRKGFSTPKNALEVQFLGTHVVDRYLRMMGENNTSERP